MNRPYESRDDRSDESESVEQSERLNEIERRLKKARPSPVSFDATLLERLAREASVHPAFERRPAATPVTRSRWRRRPFRRMAVVAGSWACGALVGALAMFVLMDGTRPGTRSPHPAQTATERPMQATASSDGVPVPEKESPDRQPPVEQRPVRQAEPYDVNAAVLAMIVDRLGNGPSSYPREGLMLRAGMHLGRKTRDTVDAPQPTRESTAARVSNEPPGDSGVSMRLEPDSVPHSPSTRQRLLDELLREMPGLTL